ncbi:MAG: hypothetical protein ABI778_12640, partial [Ignavibacteriota bacterium]
YELYLKASEFYYRRTKSDYKRSLLLDEEAVRLDPNFTSAYATIANTCQTLYRQYDHDEELLLRAEAAAQKIKELEGETDQYLWVISKITLRRGDAVTAHRYAEQLTERFPAYPVGYDALASACLALGRIEDAVSAREQELRLVGNTISMHFNLLASLNELGDQKRLYEAAIRAIPIYERYIRLNPDQYNAHIQYAIILSMGGRQVDALAFADKLSAIDSLDGGCHYNLACLYLRSNHPEQGMRSLRRAVQEGYNNREDFRRDPDLDPLRGMVEFEEMVKEMEANTYV